MLCPLHSSSKLSSEMPELKKLNKKTSISKGNLVATSNKGRSSREEKEAGDGDLDMGAVENPFSRIWHGLCELCGIIVDFILGMLNKMTNMVGSFSTKVVAAFIRSAFGIMLMIVLELPYVEALDIFEIGDTHGMSKDSVDLLPMLKITSENNLDCSGERISCCFVCRKSKLGNSEEFAILSRHVSFTLR